jgi:hypothetical protein
MLIPASLLKSAAPYALAAVVGSGAFASFVHQQRQIGVRDERLRVDQITIAALADSARRQAIVYVRDTMVLRQTVRRWDTVTARFHDSTLVHDTVSVPVERVREVVRAGDSTIHACALVVSDCQSRLTTALAIGENYRQQLALTKSAVPSRWAVWWPRIVWGAAGVAGGYLLRR